MPTEYEYPYVQTSVWGGSPDDPSLDGALNAIEKGVTSTHIASTLYTTNAESYNKALTAGIPTREFKDDYGTTVYEIHFSFGPDNNPLYGSMLDDSYLTNCLNAQLLTPVSDEDLKKGGAYKTNKVNSNLDFLNIFTREIKIYPLFTSKHPEELEKPENADIKAFQATINGALDKYLTSKRDNDSRSVYFEEVNNALMVLKSSRDPKNEMTKNQFLYYFNEKIGTIGLSPKTPIKTKLLSARELKQDPNKKGFVEERYVNEMVRIKQSMDGKSNFWPLGRLRKFLYTYNFVLFNCSHAVKSLYVNSANDTRILDKLEHTPGWKDVGRKDLPFQKRATALFLLVFGRAIETPVNFAHNLINANKEADKLNGVGQKPKPQPRPKLVNDLKSSRLLHPAPELKSRVHHHSVHPHPGHIPHSLQSLMRSAKKSKIDMQILPDAKTAVFYSKDKLIATVDLRPNSSNTINIQFAADSSLDRHQMVALLNVLKNVLKKDVEINKHSKEPVVFNIGLSDNSAVPDANALQNNIRDVFPGASVKMKAVTEETQKVEAQQQRHNTGPRTH